MVNYFYYNTDADSIEEEPRPRFPILIKGGFAACGGAGKYGEQLRQLQPEDRLLMYENKLGVVAIGRVREEWDGVAHGAPLYYKPAELGRLDGAQLEYRIPVVWFLDLTDSPILIEKLRERFSYQPGAAVTRGTIDPIMKQKDSVSALIDELMASPKLLPGEIDASAGYVEGARRIVSVDAYERNHQAVEECKRLHGTTCVICDFDFGRVYGTEFAGFIHVHHLRPLAEIGTEYRVVPATDLCPLCPNCHAVIHRGGRLRTVKEVKQLIARQSPAQLEARI